MRSSLRQVMKLEVGDTPLCSMPRPSDLVSLQAGETGAHPGPGVGPLRDKIAVQIARPDAALRSPRFAAFESELRRIRVRRDVHGLDRLMLFAEILRRGLGCHAVATSVRPVEAHASCRRRMSNRCADHRGLMRGHLESRYGAIVSALRNYARSIARRLWPDRRCAPPTLRLRSRRGIVLPVYFEQVVTWIMSHRQLEVSTLSLAALHYDSAN